MSKSTAASQAARVLAQLQWQGKSQAERSEAMRQLGAKRDKRKLAAHARRIAKLPKSITPEAARARALKAAETRRRNKAAGK